MVSRTAKPPRSSLTSIAKVVAWLAEEWIGQFIRRRQITLRMSDRFYHDLLVESHKVPLWRSHVARATCRVVDAGARLVAVA